MRPLEGMGDGMWFLFALIFRLLFVPQAFHDLRRDFNAQDFLE